MSGGDCFKCGRPGHFARECRNGPGGGVVGGGGFGRDRAPMRMDFARNGRSEDKCYKCNRPGHFARECRMDQDRCYKCNQLGHIAKECDKEIDSVLRPRKPKAKKQPPKSNAQKLREFKDRIKADPILYAEWKERKKEENRRRCANLTEEQKVTETEKARIRQQQCRARRKAAQNVVQVQEKKVTKSSDKCITRIQSHKAAEKREQNRLRQQRRRANMSSQKRRRENEKRRNQYRQKKLSQPAPNPKPRIRLDILLKGVQNSIKKCRTKLSLFKMQFLKRIISRQRSDNNHHPDSFYQRAPRRNFSVEHFLEKNSVDFPGLRGSTIQKKVLTKSMVDLLHDFKKAHPTVKMSLTTFKRRRPQHIVLSSSRKFLQCLCEKCTNIMLLVNVLNPFLNKRSDQVDGQSHRVRMTDKISDVEDLVERTLCTNARRDCWERECSKCGVGLLIEKISRVVGEKGNEIRKWSRWEKTEKSAKDLVYKESTICEIIAMMGEDLKSLSKHLKTAQWQRKIYQQLKETMPKQHALCTVDFAENYLCKYQNEVQSAHWSYKQISIHPCVFFYYCREPGCSKLITEYLIFLSDDLIHDCFFTKFVLDKCISHMKSKGMAAIHIFSDGCSSQYKSRYTFDHLTELQGKHEHISITRHYFGANHGKSLCDSCGGVVKNCAARAVASASHIIQNADQMFQFCSEKLSVSDSKIGEHCAHSSFIRSFELVTTDQLLRTQQRPTLKPVTGIKNLHSVKPVNKDVMKVKYLSCICDVCLLGEQGQCSTEDFSAQWKEVSLTRSTKKKSVVLSKRKRITLPSSTPSTSTSSNRPFAPETENELATTISTCSRPSADIVCSESIPVPVAIDQLSRHAFFATVQETMSKCQSFTELKNIVVIVSPYIHSHPLPDLTYKCVLDVGIVDAVALDLLPPTFSNKVYPVLTIADGNCVPRALSLLAFGDQNHHIEIRCRIIVELVSNLFDYLCLDDTELNFLCQISDVSNCNPEETFQQEVLSTCQKSSFMGLWQVMGASNVFGVPIVSVYPHRGPQKFRSFFNRILHPRRQAASQHKFMLMWSSTESHKSEMPLEYWTANHVVPLLHLRACYNCKSSGHVQRDCPEVSSRPCYRCGENGHLARDCPDDRGPDDRKCYGCGGVGHISRECPTAQRTTARDCYRCGASDHLARDCPDNASKTQCYNCSKMGHMARDCPMESNDIVAAA